MRQDLEGKEEKSFWNCFSILDNNTLRHLEKTSHLRLIYGVFYIRIAKLSQLEGVKI